MKERAEGRINIDIKWLLTGIIVVFLLVFQVFPMLYLLFKAFFPDGHFSLEGISRIYSYPLNWLCIKNTLVTATLSMIFGVCIAVPLAWLVGRTNLYAKSFFRTLFLTTYMVPPYVGAMAWLRLLNPKAGTLNIFIRDLFGLKSPPFNIYSIGGLVWVLTSFYYPYAFIIISRAMEHMDPSLEETSRVSGASPVKTLFTVTIPMMLPSIAASAMLVFVAAASCYGIPSIIGAPGKIYTLTTRIVDYVYVGSAQGLSDAVSLAVFLMLLSLALMYIADMVGGKKDYITVSGKSVRPGIVDLGRWRIPITVLVGLFSVIVVVIPFCSVFATSFTLNMGKSVFAPGNFTTKYWKILISRRSIISSGMHSLLAAVLAATLGMIICLVMAYLMKRTKVRGRSIPDFLIALGSGMPSVAIALSLIMTMSGRFGINIYNTLSIMVIAYMIKYMMMGMRAVVAAFSQVSTDLEESACSCGAGWFRRVSDILIPLIAPSVAAGWFLMFMPCFYELTMSNLLYSDRTKTIGVELYLYQTYHSQQTASALAGVILIVVILLNLIVKRLFKGKF